MVSVHNLMSFSFIFRKGSINYNCSNFTDDKENEKTKNQTTKNKKVKSQKGKLSSLFDFNIISYYRVDIKIVINIMYLVIVPKLAPSVHSKDDPNTAALTLTIFQGMNTSSAPTEYIVKVYFSFISNMYCISCVYIFIHHYSLLSISCLS